MVDVILGFVAIGGIIFIGFFSSLIFERTKVPDVIILIFLGLFLGPVLSSYFGIVLVPHEILDYITPSFANLALAIILFDGGLNLNFELVVRKMSVAFVHTVVAFSLSALIVGILAYFFLGFPLMVGILLGVFIGGISSAIVVPVCRGMNIKEETKTILTLEGVLTDVLCLILALSIIEFLSGGKGKIAEGALESLAAGFFVALGIGVFFGILWLGVLTRLYGKPFSYMITLAALLLLYGGVELVGGSGGMAALVFGVVIGNKDEFSQIFKMKTRFVLDEKIAQFHSELSFLIKTFFFVLLGLSFSLTFAGSNPTSVIPFLKLINGTPLLFFIAVVVIFLSLILVRYVVSFMTAAIHEGSRQDRTAIWSMVARGLAPAVLATLAFSVPAFLDGQAACVPGPCDASNYPYWYLLSPFKEQIINTIFLVILLTNIATTLGVFFFERQGAGLSELEIARQRLKRKKEAEERKKWKKEKAELRRQRIRLKKHRKRLEEKK